MQGEIFNIQKFCVHDGPGIRTTVFLKGCPLKCVWCHNPESQKKEKQILFYAHKCTGCGRCANLTVDDTDFCCYSDAKEICGKTVSTDEVIAEVMKDSAFYENSGGGITVSGGEPLFQFDFLMDILKKSKENELHTAIETCGFASEEKIRLVAEYTDLFLFDYKETDPEKHKEFTGVGNERIIENLKVLNTLKKEVVLRCPIVPGYNDRKDHYDAIAKLADELDCINHIDIEPYHSLGEGKYDAMGETAVKIPMPTKDEKDEIVKYIAAKTKKTVKLS